MKRMLLSLAVAILFATSAFAKIIRVPADQPTIQAAINAAARGDTILVADGTYYENINFKGKAITVASHYWADGDTNHINNTIINGSKPSHPDSGSVVYFISGEDTNSVLTGFTITGGRGTPTILIPGLRERDGGGIFIWSAGAKIEWNKIINNHIATAGDTGAIGAGINVVGEVGDYIVIRNNDISHNNATTTNSWADGAVGLATKETCVFEKNQIRHNVCNGSIAAAGGGLYIYGGLGFQGPYIIRENIISGNMLLNGSNTNAGGGVVIHNASPILINNIVSDNVARAGGGIWVYHEPLYTGMPRPVLINNTITNNSATEEGGGICVSGTPQAYAIVMNTILWRNSAAADPQISLTSGGSITVRYSDVQGGWSGEGNINADPRLVADSLSNDSPCIGAGVGAYDFGGGMVLSCPPYDINGRLRPFPAGSKPDMGAVEHTRAFPQGHLVEVPNDYPTIQAAINAAAKGDTVLVAEGTYYENINFKGKAITVASHYWADGDTNHINNTIMNGSRPSHPDSGSVVYFISGEDTNSVLTGFTFTGGKGTVTRWAPEPGYLDKDGGGVFVKNSGAKIEKNKITQNHIAATGDTSAGASGIMVTGDVGNYIVIRDNDISQNTAMATGVYGYAFGTVGLGTKGTCVFENNRVSHNVVTTTIETAGAGGLCIDGQMNRPGPYLIRNNVINGNRVTAPGTKGIAGGVLIQNCSPIFTNNIISSNVSSADVGGVFVYHWPVATGIPKPIFINNTITNNRAGTSGGGIDVTGQQASAIVMNTILWGNSAPTNPQIGVYGGGSITVRYSDVQGGWSGEGNINADPLLMADSLSNDSKCIGAGTHVYDFGNGIVCQCPDKDITGRPRPYPTGTKPDIGAWESMLWTTAVESQPSAEIPKAYALHQNHPNPFNPSTSIEFALPKASFVTLKIYDLLGNEVATLVSEKLPAGRHQRVWEAKDLASGVYLYRLEAGEFMQTMKLILLR